MALSVQVFSKIADKAGAVVSTRDLDCWKGGREVRQEVSVLGDKDEPVMFTVNGKRDAGLIEESRAAAILEEVGVNLKTITAAFREITGSKPPKRTIETTTSVIKAGSAPAASPAVTA